METLKSTKVDWKKITVVGALLVLMSLVAALTTWYFMDDMARKEVKSYQAQIATLQDENSELKNSLELIESVFAGEENEEVENNEDGILPCACGEAEDAALCPNCPAEGEETQE